MAKQIPAVVNLAFPNGRKLDVPTGLFIDNKFVPSVEGATIDSINPVTEELLATVSSATEQDIDIAVASSRNAFKNRMGSQLPTCATLADLLERDAEAFAGLEALDNGKSAQVAREVDLPDSIACIRYYAGWADKIFGQTIEVDDKGLKSASTRVEPFGVCAQIIPWNYNIMMLAWKIGPALAAGCTVILKPSELTPLPALKFSELVAEAGFPPGVFNCVPSYGPIGGAALASHLNVDKVAFTGSTLTGRKIMQAAALSNLKKVTLELGGKSPHIIFESANLKDAATHVTGGIFLNQGQDCSAGSRLYVQASVYDAFLKELKASAEEWTAGYGDNFKEGALGGPLVSKAQRDKVVNYVEGAKEAGASILYGGTKWEGKGWYYLPTIIGDVTPDMKVVKEEVRLIIILFIHHRYSDDLRSSFVGVKIFGPVLVVSKFNTEEEVIELANNTTYGLGAGFHSSDANQCQRVQASLEAGTVWVNQYGLLYNQSPFGGYKQSGIGRELGSYAIDNYTQIKTVLWDYSGGSSQ
ncbi:NAD-aldehyde dehydrogenase [Cantharellus anzutake]|uniref:NAD-aldehyde dehydrogenase n=1 Tax=Cantharellus anzutake TaxID=1750568 RepID=UPI0019082461|nr:NAD-aldehyde dehydrogenase [Cantharellus anzutake]KAF8314876.1 NAD-aldehyde dehydrogenase [Cantharellus anzutake]